MYALSNFTPLGFTFLNGYRHVELGSALSKCVLLSGDLPPRRRNSRFYQFALIFFPALISGRLFDLGYLHSTLIFASITLVACTFSIAECHEFWQLLLLQGIGIGVSLPIPHLKNLIPTVRCSQISCGLVFGIVMSVIAHWFKKRRSAALGINAFASSIGGTVFPVVFRSLLIAVGYAQLVNLRISSVQISLSFKWTMRIIAGILAIAIGVTNVVCIPSCT
jgi:MCP family monocarboxylic acid transporter-like MFS transporter 10